MPSNFFQIIFKQGTKISPWPFIGDPVTIKAADNGFILAQIDNDPHYYLIEAKMTAHWRISKDSITEQELIDLSKFSWSYFTSDLKVKLQCRGIPPERCIIVGESNEGWIKVKSCTDSLRFYFHPDASYWSKEEPPLGYCWIEGEKTK